MSFDGFTTHIISQELRQALIGGRLSKIYQPYEQELQFAIRNQGQNYRLNASIHPVYYRLHLTQEKSSNPQQAPMFCMILRKHLENAQILDIYQQDNDRVVVMELSGRDELGDLNTYQLIFELMGRHSNILLVNPQKQTIIDCIKHVPAYLNSYRVLQAGAPYQAAPTDDQQVNLMDQPINKLKDFVDQAKIPILEGQAGHYIQGLGKLGQESLAGLITESGRVQTALESFIDQVKSPQYLLLEKKDKLFFYFMNPDPSAYQVIDSFDSMSSLLDKYYNQKAKQDHIKQISGNLIQKVKQVLDKNMGKLKKLAKDYQTAANAEDYRIKGELLSAYGHQVQKGLTQVDLPNYYEDNQPLTIALNPAKSAIENSQAYFKRYSKYRDSLRFIKTQEEKTNQENDYLENVLVQIQQADIEDIDDIKAELQDQGYVSKDKQKLKKRAKSNSKPRRYKSSDGVMIYVGRNNKQNDQLSLKQAAKNHWWLHTKNIPGAHVIIESDKPSDRTITQAAQIAAYYSKSQGSSNVPVDLVQVKHLRKPNGAKPGFVIYEGQHTVFVTPEEAEIEALKVK